MGLHAPNALSLIPNMKPQAIRGIHAEADVFVRAVFGADPEENTVVIDRRDDAVPRQLHQILRVERERKEPVAHIELDGGPDDRVRLCEVEIQVNSREELLLCCADIDLIGSKRAPVGGRIVVRIAAVADRSKKERVAVGESQAEPRQHRVLKECAWEEQYVGANLHMTQTHALIFPNFFCRGTARTQGGVDRDVGLHGAP